MNEKKTSPENTDSTTNAKAKDASKPNASWQSILILLLVLAIIALLGRDIMAKRGLNSTSWNSQLANKLSMALKTHVGIEGDSLVLDEMADESLPILRQKINVVTHHQPEWLGSDGVIVIKGTYFITGGYKLTEKSIISADENTKLLTLTLPKASLLNVQPDSQSVVYSSKKIDPKKQAKELKALYAENAKKVSQAADEVEFLSNVQSRLEDRLRDLVSAETSMTILNDIPIN